MSSSQSRDRQTARLGARRGTVRSWPATNWSLVLRAARPDGQERREALGDLYRSYHPLICRLLQGRGVPEHLAADLAQELFSRLFSGNDLERVDFGGREPGTFSSWLNVASWRVALNHFRRERALKRGGRRPPLGLDAPEVFEVAAAAAAERRFGDDVVRACQASFIVQRAYERLRRDHAVPREALLVSELYRSLSGEARSTTDKELAVLFNQTEAHVRAYRHRIRKQFGEYLKSEGAFWFPDSPCIKTALRRLAELD